MGRRIWINLPGGDRTDSETGRVWHMPSNIVSCRVLSFKQFLPAGEDRKKHLVQLWTDPGGMRTLSIGSILLKDPGRVAAGLARAAATSA